MGKNYRSMLPSGDSQQQGGQIGVRQDKPRQQEKPDNILQVINNKVARREDNPQQTVFYKQREYEYHVKVVIESKMLVETVTETVGVLNEQLKRLNGIPIDVMRNNSHKLVNQDIDVAPLEDMNRKTEDTLHEVARNIHDSSLMIRYTEELTKKDREKWQLSEVDKAMMKVGDKACEYIERKAESHLARLVSRMEWLPVAYHLVDKAALVVFPILGYYTGRHHLNDTMVFLWLIAAVPILLVLVIWGVNELWNWVDNWNLKTKKGR